MRELGELERRKQGTVSDRRRIAGYEAVQSQMDEADSGLNPLGLAKNVVPFDIDPSLIASGKTHFEQVYERAIEAMKSSTSMPAAPTTARRRISGKALAAEAST